MKKIYFETKISKSVEEIKAEFDRSLFIYLSKGLMPFDLVRFDGCQKDNEVHIKLGLRPLSFTWISLITSEEQNEKGWSFVDEGRSLPWPLIYWRHHHRVDKISEKEARIVDDITFDCSPSFLSPIVKPFLWHMFSLRPKRYKSYFKD